MKTRRVAHWMKNTIALFLVTIICVSAVGTVIRAWEDKGSDGSYLSYVDIETNDLEFKLRGGLRPNIVPKEITWDNFAKELKVTDYLILSTKHSGESDITTVVVVDIYFKNSWRHIVSCYDEYMDDGLYEYDSEEWDNMFNILNKKEYISIRFGYSDRNGHDTYLYARFARGYNVTYQLDGGRFEKNQDTVYAAGADYSIPNPVREGFVFEGWTGTGLNEKTKNLVIKNGEKGDKVYTANWSASESTKGNKMLSSGATGIDSKAKEEANLKKVKIKKALKDANSKKVKISIGKIANATGYKIQISEKKNFGKVLVTKNVKKANFTIKSNKVKEKKKLYVRAKACKSTTSGMIWSENWSDIKKVTVN